MFRFTIRDVLWLMVVVAVALAVYFAKPRTQWEYKIESPSGPYSVPNLLDERAAEGWELMAVQSDPQGSYGGAYYFRRRK